MNKEKRLQTSYIAIGIFFFSYVLIRAYTLGITFDEAWTTSYVFQPVSDILNYTICSTNNHILNTLLIKLFFIFGNHSLFIARLPNVIAFILYLYFSYKITYKYMSPVIGALCYLILLLNPFVLDFFSLARGYGLLLGLESASLYFLIQFVLESKIKCVLWSLIWGALAVLSNFSALNYFLVILLLINFISVIFKNKYNYKLTFLTSILIGFVLTYFIYEPIKKLKDHGSFDWGGDTGFYSDTLISLTQSGLYKYNVEYLAPALLNIFLSITLLSIIISFFSNRTILSAKNLFLSVTILCIISVIVQHYLLGTLYLMDRTALFFYPLFIFTLCFSLNDINYKLYVRTIVSIFLIFFSLNFYLNANTYKTSLWYFDAHSSEILNWLNQKGKEQNKKLKIDFSWPFEASFSYYFNMYEYPFLDLVKNKSDRDDLNPAADYYIYLSQSLEKNNYFALKQKILSFKKDTIKQYEKEGIVIYSNIRK